jgi:hypothetical protein
LHNFGHEKSTALKAVQMAFIQCLKGLCFFEQFLEESVVLRFQFGQRAQNQCNLVWLENLNLRGGYKKTIFDYITEKHPDLLPLYDTIYNKKERSYWSMLDAQMRQFCQEEGLLYVRDDDSIKRPFNDPPIVVNYFFNEEIIPRPKCRRTGNQNYIVTCRKLEVVEVRL